VTGKDADRMTRSPSPIVDVDTQRLDEVLRRAEQSLDGEDFELTKAIFESYAYLTDLVEDKNTSLRRLRQLLFGHRSEKSEAVLGDSASGPAEPADGPTEDHRPVGPQRADEKPTPKGHGRNGAEAYQGGERIRVRHPSLHPGDACPDCQRGTLYDATPGVLVRIVGAPPLHARVYELQKLRCHLCGKLFTAEPPAEAGARKYDATAAAMIALLKYGSGLPFNRLEGLQRNLRVPLPASTQWDVVHAFAPCVTPAFDELLRQAAQGQVLHNDDTTVKILEWMGARGEHVGDPSDSARSGLFTSGVVALRDGRRVALFFSGRRHAGENLQQVLRHRVADLGPPIQMCDALARNLPGELETIVANCLAHARRQFVEVHDRFPDECRQVLEALQVVYRNDAAARQRGLSPEQRLAFHRAESGPTMERLRTWLSRQFDERLVEPNSALGAALNYLRKHWRQLTLFLQQAGAPLDNNVCERALKKAILHRKNALFYKTRNGARVGDLYMSLIHTCELAGASPFDYLVALHNHAHDLAARPQHWMPWNYQDALADR